VLFVECAGVPGSGKSEITDRFQAWLTGSNVSFVDVAAFLRCEAARLPISVPQFGDKLDLGSKDADVLLKSFRHFFLDEPLYVLRYLQSVLELEPSRAGRDLVLSSFNFACAQRGYFWSRRERVDADVVIHEEGLVHRLFTLFGYRTGALHEESLLRDLAVLTPSPDVLIWTRCSPRVALERLECRERKKPDRLVDVSPEVATEILASADRKIAMVATILSERGTRVLEARTDADFDEVPLFEAIFSDVKGC
jgi:hypothetical protein